jgi:catalase
MQNFQRDAVMRMEVAEGGVADEPNSLAPDSPRENPRVGFTTFPAADGGGKSAGAI